MASLNEYHLGPIGGRELPGRSEGAPADGEADAALSISEAPPAQHVGHGQLAQGEYLSPGDKAQFAAEEYSTQTSQDGRKSPTGSDVVVHLDAEPDKQVK